MASSWIDAKAAVSNLFGASGMVIQVHVQVHKVHLLCTLSLLLLYQLHLRSSALEPRGWGQLL